MINVQIKEFDSQRFYLLVHRIKQNKAAFYEAMENDAMTYRGTRYNNDERMAQMIVGSIYGEVDFDLEEAKRVFLSLTSSEMDCYIKAAVYESTSADFYYKFEKEY